MVTVFISHSTGQDKQVEQIRNTLYDILTANGYDVWLDKKRLQPNQSWPSNIPRARKCDAAIVLLNENEMLTSDWVKREVSILLWRQALWPRLHIYWANVGKFDPEKVKNAGFSGLEYIQGATSTEEDPARAIQDLCNKIGAHFDKAPSSPSNTPMSDWIKNVSGYLKSVKDRDSLKEAAEVLQADSDVLDEISKIDGTAPFDKTLLLAHWLLDHSDYVVDAFNKIVHSMDKPKRFAKLITPIWVPADAAQRLLQEDKQPEDPDRRDAQYAGVAILSRLATKRRPKRTSGEHHAVRRTASKKPRSSLALRASGRTRNRTSTVANQSPCYSVLMTLATSLRS